jgi:hypothetical protein
MTTEELKAGVREASPEVREELYVLLGVLRRAGQPGRAQALARKVDDPTGWISEEEAARRLGVETNGDR